MSATEDVPGIERMTLCERVSDLAQEVGEALIPPACLGRLCAAADLFGDIRCTFALESHPQAAAPRVDLVVRIDAKARDELIARAPISAGASQFMESWAVPESALWAMPFIEFEFDLAAEGLQEPWIGAAVEPALKGGFQQTRADEGSQTGYRTGFALAVAIISALKAEVAPELMARLARSYEVLPAGASVIHFAPLSLRPASPAESLRLIVSLPRSALSRYLRRVEWRGDLARLDKCLERFQPYAAFVDFDLDLCLNDGGDRIAFYRDARPPRVADSQTRELVRALEEDGHLTPGIADALHCWIRRVDGQRTRELTFKMGFRPGMPLVVKPYFSDLQEGGEPHGHAAQLT